MMTNTKYAIAGRDSSVCSGWSTDIVDGGVRANNLYDDDSDAAAAMVAYCETQGVDPDDVRIVEIDVEPSQYPHIGRDD